MRTLHLIAIVISVSFLAVGSMVWSKNVEAITEQAAVSQINYEETEFTEEALNNTQAEINSLVTVPNDPFYSAQWSLQRMGRTLSNGQNEVIVAILETGIDRTHEDLEGVVVDSVNFTKSDTDSDILGHGTHIAGIVAASANNGIGIAGIASNAKLLNVKVAEDDGLVWPSVLAKGIIWAVDHGAQIVNISLYVPNESFALENAVRYAREHGVIIAGNHVSALTYPSAYKDVISVASENEDGTIWSGNLQLDHADVYAPGEKIYSTFPGNKYAYKSGSSMATAYVSGLAACIIGDSEKSYEDIRKEIINLSN